jgi:cyclohexa-1,5-dienecarbonyl-CoA hydratase
MIETERLKEGGVLRVRLNRPKANILDGEMVSAIAKALDDVDDQLRLIVFEGAGKHFSFGASVPEHTAPKAAAMLATFHGMFRKLGQLGVPTVALVRGQCLGGGLELASWCSWLVADPGANLGQPEIQLAVFPPMASLILPWRAGGRAALDLCLSGRSLTAQQALEMGIANAVTEDPEGWWQSLYDERLAPMSASSLRYAERAARATLLDDLETRLPALEALYLDELMKTQDANEGLAAFMEKRAPQYTHQ